MFILLPPLLPLPPPPPLLPQLPQPPPLLPLLLRRPSLPPCLSCHPLPLPGSLGLQLSCQASHRTTWAALLVTQHGNVIKKSVQLSRVIYVKVFTHPIIQSYK